MTPKKPAAKMAARRKSTAQRREQRRRRVAKSRGQRELSVRVDADLAELITRLAQETDRSSSSLIRQAVRHYADHLAAGATHDEGDSSPRPIQGLRERGLIA